MPARSNWIRLERKHFMKQAFDLAQQVKSIDANILKVTRCPPTALRTRQR